MLIDYNKIPVLIKKIFKNKKGISVVELLVVAVIMAIGLVSLFNAVTSSLKISSLMKENDQAKELAQEAMEAVRSFRDGTDWDSNGLGTLIIDPFPKSFHPCNTNSLEVACQTLDDPPKWVLLPNEGIVGIFTRKVVFSKISRDPTSGNIESVYNPVHDDSNTRKVTATVSWGTGKVEISTYLTNWR